MHSMLPAILLAAALAGCASVPIAPLPSVPPGASSEVVVYRESAFAAGGVGLAVGSSGHAFAVLANAEKVRARMPPGEHEIFVQARSAEPTRQRVKLSPGRTVCLRTSASPSTLAKVLVPITLIATGYHFYLYEVPCPPESELGKYKDIPVTYR